MIIAEMNPDTSGSSYRSELRYRLRGQEHQMLLVTLGPHEAIKTERGAMAFRDDDIKMDTRFGSQRSPGVVKTMLRMASRRVSGENLVVNVYVNQGVNDATIAISPRHPANIQAIELSPDAPDLICRRGTYLAGSVGVDPGAALTDNVITSFIARTGFVLQKIVGHGTAFIAGNGIIVPCYLEAGQTYRAETDSILAWDESVQYDIGVVRGLRNLTMGGEGFFISTFTGPGYVYFQSISEFALSRSAVRAMLRQLDNDDKNAGSRK